MRLVCCTRGDICKLPQYFGITIRYVHKKIGNLKKFTKKRFSGNFSSSYMASVQSWQPGPPLVTINARLVALGFNMTSWDTPSMVTREEQEDYSRD